VELEDRDLPRLGQAAGDRLADARQLAPLDLAGRRRHRRSGGCGSGFGALDVLGHDSPLRPCARERGQVDTALPRDPSRQRRCLHPPPVARGLGLPRLRNLLARLARGLASLFALLLARGCRRALLLRILVDLLRSRAVAAAAQIGCLFPFLADDRDRLADRHLALLHCDLQQHAGRLGLDLLRDLVGVELIERLAFFDAVALGLEPLDDRAGLHALAQPRQLYLVGHVPSGQVQVTVTVTVTVTVPGTRRKRTG